MTSISSEPPTAVCMRPMPETKSGRAIEASSAPMARSNPHCTSITLLSLDSPYTSQSMPCRWASVVAAWAVSPISGPPIRAWPVRESQGMSLEP